MARKGQCRVVDERSSTTGGMVRADGPRTRADGRSGTSSPEDVLDDLLVPRGADAGGDQPREVLDRHELGEPLG